MGHLAERSPHPTERGAFVAQRRFHADDRGKHQRRIVADVRPRRRLCRKRVLCGLE
jgi:hypothetical protein